MKSLILCSAFILFLYSCNETSGKQTGKNDPASQLNANANNIPPDHLRVRKNEGRQMRGRRDKDTAAVKISVSDLQSIMTASSTPNDSLIFFFVKYDSPQDRDRYLQKVPNANWSSVRGKSSVLVGFISGSNGTMNLTRNRTTSVVSVYDLGVVCPPPPSCDCEIAQ